MLVTEASSPTVPLADPGELDAVTCEVVTEARN
jgi:hypothetical protein